MRKVVLALGRPADRRRKRTRAQRGKIFKVSRRTWEDYVSNIQHLRSASHCFLPRLQVKLQAHQKSASSWATARAVGLCQSGAEIGSIMLSDVSALGALSVFFFPGTAASFVVRFGWEGEPVVRTIHPYNVLFIIARTTTVNYIPPRRTESRRPS